MNTEINKGKAKKSGYIRSSKERESNRLGISFEFIVSWVQDLSIPESLTTKEVCDQLIKQATHETKLSFCEQLLKSKNTAKFVGVPSVFITHSWKDPFVKVVEALTSYFAPKKDVIIWFDVFSCNQHKAASLEAVWWRGTLKDVVISVGHTVMVLASWNDLLPLQRAWCIWELYWTFEGSCKFDVAMCADSIEQFESDVETFRTRVIKILATIDISKSECSKPDDREKIHEQIRRTVGFHDFNKKICKIMGDWMISRYQEKSRFFRNSGIQQRKEFLDTLFMNDLAVLYSILGEYDSASPLYEECLKMINRF